jgi:hypothetical protein
MTSIAYKQPHGWSKLDKYRGCPQQFKYVYIDKLKEPESKALTHGSEVHGGLETYLNGWGKTMPDGVLKVWHKRIDKLKERHDVKTEAAWGVTRDWLPLSNWLHPDCWIRAKSDFFYFDGDTLVLGDFKTGQYRVPSDDQIELYAVIGHAMFPLVKNVRASFWFVEQAVDPLELLYTDKQLINLRGKFTQEFIKMEKERKWAPTPSNKCKWCTFSRQKNGPCKY